MQDEQNQDIENVEETSGNVSHLDESTEATSTSENSGIETTENENSSEEGQEEQASKPEPRVPVRELQKERAKKREAERINRELMEKLAALENKVDSLNEPSLVSEIANDLNLDEETAKKLVKSIDRVSRKGLSSRTPDTGVDQAKLSDFTQRVRETSEDFDDWEAVQGEMETVFKEKFARSGNKAFDIDPEEYYYQAKGRLGLTSDASRKAGAQEAIRKVNSKNLSVTESANSSSSGKPKRVQQWTRARIKNLSQEEWSKHGDTIMRLMKQGKITE